MAARSFRSGGEGSGGAAPGTELQRYWEILKARKGLVLAVWAVTFAGVALGTLLQTPLYRATGTLEIRSQGAEVVPLEAVFDLARIPDQHLTTQYGVLRSPTLARRVISDLNLLSEEEFAPPDGAEAEGGGADAAAVELAVTRFLSRMTVERIQDSRLVQVSFDSRDPDLAARVVNSVFDNYIRIREDAGGQAVENLARQVEEARERLAEAERQLQDFAVENGLHFIEGGAGETENMVLERLRQLQAQLTQAEGEAYQQQARYAQIAQASPDALDSPVLRSLAVPLAELEGEYARLRTTFTDSFPRAREMRRQIESLRAEVDRERARIASEIGQEFSTASTRRELLRRAFEEQKELAERLAGMTAEYRILRRDAEGHQELYSMLQQKQKEAGVTAALASTEAALFDPAVPPLEPIRPRPDRNLPLGALAGLLLAIGAAFLRDYTDQRVRRIEEVGAMDVPILGVIPSARSLEGRGGLRLGRGGRVLNAAGHGSGWVRIDRDGWQQSGLAEAFGGLRTSLLFQSMRGPVPRSLLVTSVRAGDGKTTVSMNLAISLARLGRSVLLIDADTRRPALHRAFELGPGPGLVEYLEGEVEWQDVLAERTPGLAILPAGRAPESPTELLSSERMATLVAEAESAFEFVIVDAPAILVNVADARILSPLTDGVVLVARSGVTPREVLRGLIEGTPNLVGVVLNDIDQGRFPEYYYDYGVEGRAPNGGRQGRARPGDGDATPGWSGRKRAEVEVPTETRS